MTDKSDAAPENPPQQHPADTPSEVPPSYPKIGTYPEIGTVEVRSGYAFESPAVGVERTFGEIVIEYPEVGQEAPPDTAGQGQ
ncbi:MAG TPA: hypothetical protein VG317_01845 [Pseudonocardiaceae bacterium]|jgi:hypothetical protein|nr:hypothetical protein [Pseudonocardiaceae bacterium]